MSNNENCLVSVVRLIDNLQRESECDDICDNTCSRPFLGNCGGLSKLNTRPVTFYTCDNNLVTVEYTTKHNKECHRSGVFRVKSINGNCVTCTILAPNPDCDGDPFISTNQTAIINLNCCCAIKCLPDTTVCL